MKADYTLYNRRYNALFAAQLSDALENGKRTRSDKHANVVCQVYYWLELAAKEPDKHKRFYKHGRFWAKFPMKTTKPRQSEDSAIPNDWIEQFPQIKLDNLKSTFDDLVKSGVLIAMSDGGYVRTLSYSINFELLYKLCPGSEVFLPPLCIEPTMVQSQMISGTTNNGLVIQPTMDCGLNHQAIYKNNKNTDNNISNNTGSMEFYEQNSTRLNFDIVKRQIKQVCKDMELNPEDADTLTEIFKYYYTEFKRHIGRIHPRLSNANIQKVIENLRSSEDEDTHTEFRLADVGVDTVKRMIDNYFTEQPGLECDSILHFTSAGILIHRYQEAMRDSDGLPFD